MRALFEEFGLLRGEIGHLMALSGLGLRPYFRQHLSSFRTGLSSSAAWLPRTWRGGDMNSLSRCSGPSIFSSMATIDQGPAPAISKTFHHRPAQIIDRWRAFRPAAEPPITSW